MPGITNPAEEYFKDGQWAWDPVGKVWKKLIIDPLTDQLSVAVNNDAEVHQVTPANMRTGAHGWDGTVWRKLPLVFGYSSRLAEYKTGVAAGAGHAVCSTTAVAPGHIRVLQVVSASHNAGVNKGIEVYHVVAGVSAPLIFTTATATGAWEILTCEVVLAEGDQITAYAIAPGAGKSVYMHVRGYQMKIAE